MVAGPRNQSIRAPSRGPSLLLWGRGSVNEPTVQPFNRSPGIPHFSPTAVSGVRATRMSGRPSPSMSPTTAPEGRWPAS